MKETQTKKEKAKETKEEKKVAEKKPEKAKAEVKTEENKEKAKAEEKKPEIAKLEEKKPEEKSKKRMFLFVIAIILLILLVFLMFFYYVMASPSRPSPDKTQSLVADIDRLNIENAISQFNEGYISYVIFAIDGWKLHSPPFSEDTPKIKVVVDGETYVSEVIAAEIKTEKREIDDEDIVMNTTKREIVLAIMSPDIKGHIKQSIQAGNTTLELKASYTKLLSKGYLPIYQDLTGRGFTGSVIRIFQQG